MSIYDYKQLRLKTDLLDDTDWVATQAVPSGAVTLAGVAQSTGTIQVRWALEWLDVAGARVNGAGSFDYQVIRVTDHPSSGVPYVEGAPAVVGGAQGESYIEEDLRAGDKLDVRLTNLVGPGATTQCRLLYSESQE